MLHRGTQVKVGQSWLFIWLTLGHVCSDWRYLFFLTIFAMMDVGSNVRLMSWWRMQRSRSRSSCRSNVSLRSVLWLLVVCLAPGGQGQRLKESEVEQPGARVHLAESDAVCHQDGCYAVFLQKRTFREAGRSCRERGGTLATMHTHDAASLVHELLSGMESLWSRHRLRLWIGLHRPPRQCSSTRPLRGFVWVTGKVSPF